MKRIIAGSLLMLAFLASAPLVLAETPTPETGALSQPGITPGMTISQHNWQVAKDLLLPEILRHFITGSSATMVEVKDEAYTIKTPVYVASFDERQKRTAYSDPLREGFFVEYNQGLTQESFTQVRLTRLGK